MGPISVAIVVPFLIAKLGSTMKMDKELEEINHDLSNYSNIGGVIPCAY